MTLLFRMFLRKRRMHSHSFMFSNPMTADLFFGWLENLFRAHDLLTGRYNMRCSDPSPRNQSLSSAFVVTRWHQAYFGTRYRLVTEKLSISARCMRKCTNYFISRIGSYLVRAFRSSCFFVKGPFPCRVFSPTPLRPEGAISTVYPVFRLGRPAFIVLSLQLFIKKDFLAITTWGRK